MGKRYVNQKNSRTEEQRRIMEQIAQDGVCPFCIKHLKKYHKKPIILKGRWWHVTENMFPYEGSRLHILFIYKKHITSIPEVAQPAMYELFQLIKATIKKYDIEVGTLLWRFGDTKYNGSSVHHLHVQLIVGDVNKPNHKPIRVKIG